MLDEYLAKENEASGGVDGCVQSRGKVVAA